MSSYSTQELESALQEPIVLLQDVDGGSIIRRTSDGLLMQVTHKTGSSIVMEAMDGVLPFRAGPDYLVKLVAGPVRAGHIIRHGHDELIWRSDLSHAYPVCCWLHAYQKGWRQAFIDSRTMAIGAIYCDNGDEPARARISKDSGVERDGRCHSVPSRVQLLAPPYSSRGPTRLVRDGCPDTLYNAVLRPMSEWVKLYEQGWRLPEPPVPQAATEMFVSMRSPEPEIEGPHLPIGPMTPEEAGMPKSYMREGGPGIQAKIPRGPKYGHNRLKLATVYGRKR